MGKCNKFYKAIYMGNGMLQGLNGWEAKKGGNCGLGMA